MVEAESKGEVGEAPRKVVDGLVEITGQGERSESVREEVNRLVEVAP